jgi:hypothetical protein
MSASLIDLARQYLTPDVLDRLAAYAGETPAAAGKAMAGATPAVLAGMLNTAQGSGGLTTLVNLFQQGKVDAGMLGNLSNALSGNSIDGLIKAGGPLLTSLFGARSGGLTDLLASTSGVKKSSASSLLGVAGPFVMSLIAKQLSSSGGVTASGLKDLLFSQRQAVAAAAPPGLAGALGISDLSTMGATPHARDPVTPAHEERSGLPKWLPWLVGLALLLLLFSWMRGCGKAPATGVVTDTTSTMTAPAPAAPAPTHDTTRPAAAPVTVDTPRTSGAGGIGDAPSAGTARKVLQDSSPTAPTPGVGAMGGQGAAGKDTPGRKP